MAGRRPTKIPAVDLISINDVDDPAVARALTQIAEDVSALQARLAGEAFEVDLEIGMNVIVHNLGRQPRSVIVTPTIADSSFAWAYRRDALLGAKQLLIEVIGTAQPRALVEVH
jgi:hypothetical protein